MAGNAIIIVDRKYKKTVSEVIRMFDKRDEIEDFYDSYALVLAIECLQKESFSITFRTWGDGWYKEVKCGDIVVVLHDFITSENINAHDYIGVAQRIGSHVIYGHHSLETKLDVGWIECIGEKGYIKDKVEYKISSEDNVLANGIESIIRGTGPVSDEITFVKNGDNFNCIVTKHAVKKEQLLGKAFVCFGYQVENNTSYNFIIDLHNVGGAHGRINKELFVKMFENALIFLQEKNLCEDKSKLAETLPLNPKENKIKKSSIISYGSGGESENHRLMKEFIAANPEIIGLPVGVTANTEYLFYSADRADIVFVEKDLMVAVEIKSEISPDEDVYRGLHQCVKYQALLQAEQIINGEYPNAKAILVLAGPIPIAVVEDAARLNIKILGNIEYKPKVGVAVVTLMTP